ncbi:MAG: sodium/proline symporter PutP [Clostridia bacterium]|nr:sodium/proline symporter PutP [Clostridia bacterium]
MKVSIIVAFVVYFVGMLSVGFVFMKGQKGEKEYFLGGRSMGPWVTAMSAQASDMSGWLLMGFPGSILAFGMGQVWIGIGLALGTALNWIFVAKRLRNFSAAANDSITLPQYLRNRFATKSKALQIICAIVFLVFFTIYVASSFVAGEKVFESVIPAFGEHKVLALLIFALIIIIYTFSGGFKAVCWTDFFQGILMLIAMLAVPIIMMMSKSGIEVGTVQTVAGAANESMNPFAASWKDIISGLAWGLGYFGMPHILVRFMSIRKAKEVKKSATVAIIWVVLTLGAAVVIGLLARKTAVGASLVAAEAQENVFIEVVKLLFPGFIAGVLLSAIIAAAMSTADSQLLVASSSFTSDIYKPVFRKDASEKEVLWVGRIVVAVVAIVAFFIAKSGLPDANGEVKEGFATSIMGMVSNAWGGFGSAFGPVIILSLFWKRFTYKGAIAGVVSGAVVDVLWLIFLTDSTGIYELAPGFAAGLIFAVVATLIDKKPSAEVVAIYEAGVKGEE